MRKNILKEEFLNQITNTDYERVIKVFDNNEREVYSIDVVDKDEKTDIEKVNRLLHVLEWLDGSDMSIDFFEDEDVVKSIHVEYADEEFRYTQITYED